MKINISSGVGTGPTKLSAFDDALIKAGVANYNIIRLSSVIPPNTSLQIVERISPDGNWGDRLYVVMADKRVDTPNVEAWAGIGWVQDDKTGKGLFVEHEGNSEATVRQDIQDSLKALMKGRDVDFGPISMHVTGSMCHGDPVCALVVAVYQSSSWQK
ncbi:MAG: pyruvoyl-dependent arginine decarboxylase [Candidatus Saccharimonadia bacterium]